MRIFLGKTAVRLADKGSCSQNGSTYQQMCFDMLCASALLAEILYMQRQVQI